MRPLVTELRNARFSAVASRANEVLDLEDLGLDLVDRVCSYVLNWCEFQQSWGKDSAPHFGIIFDVN